MMPVIKKHEWWNILHRSNSDDGRTCEIASSIIYTFNVNPGKTSPPFTSSHVYSRWKTLPFWSRVYTQIFLFLGSTSQPSCTDVPTAKYSRLNLSSNSSNVDLIAVSPTSTTNVGVNGRPWKVQRCNSVNLRDTALGVKETSGALIVFRPPTLKSNPPCAIFTSPFECSNYQAVWQSLQQ